MKNASRIVLALAALVIIVGASYALMKASVGISRNALGSQAGKLPGCGGCYNLSDNGHTIAIVTTARITVSLPSAGYDKNTLSITPPGILGETFGANAQPGNWVRTFEAVHSGIAMVTVPSLNGSYADYRLMVNIK